MKINVKTYIRNFDLANSEFKCHQMVIRLGEKSAAIDLCLIEELSELWLNGVRTIECCCGHGSKHAYILVNKDDEDKIPRRFKRQNHKNGILIKPKKINHRQVF